MRILSWIKVLILIIVITDSRIGASEQDIPGIYLRSYEDDIPASSYDMPGLKLTLESNGLFEAEAIGNTSSKPNQINIDVIGKETGRWTRRDNLIILDPNLGSGVYAKTRPKRFKIVEYAGRPALLDPDDEAFQHNGAFPFLFLFLKERPRPQSSVQSSTTRVEADKAWRHIVEVLSSPSKPDISRIIGAYVRIEGSRRSGEGWNGTPLRIAADGIDCEVQNDIDGTRCANAWVCAFAAVSVEGTITSIDTDSKIVHIQPTASQITMAR